MKRRSIILSACLLALCLGKTASAAEAFLNQIGAMWASQPNWIEADLARIKTPVLIFDGEHDEAIGATTPRCWQKWSPARSS